MANFFINFLDANGILSNFLFGFRHKNSTTHAIITLTERISKSLDTGKIVCGIFIDFRKTFDVIPHETLSKNYIFMEYVEICVTGLKVISQNALSMLSFRTLN